MLSCLRENILEVYTHVDMWYLPTRAYSFLYVILRGGTPFGWPTDNPTPMLLSKKFSIF